MKRIVICSDGTGNDKSMSQPTNVAKMHEATREFQPDQIAWYDPGVGVGNLGNRLYGGAMGKGLAKNVTQAYTFLAQTYEPGDEVYLFGFSRGAFTVRSLVGLIRNIGLLRTDRLDYLPVGMKMYRKENCGPNSDIAIRFRAENSIDMPVKFMGVWDTVGSMGIPFRRLSFDRFWLKRYGFHDARLSGMVENAHQALAIDEKRSLFKPSIWFDKNIQRGSSAKSLESDQKFFRRNSSFFASGPMEEVEDPTPASRPDQTVEQVWFRGCHSDIGGSTTPPGLSVLTFEWIAARAEALGLQIDRTKIMPTYDLKAKPVVHESLTGVKKYLGKYVRPIKETSSDTESVDQSVLDLVAESPESYRPDNLLKDLAKNPPPPAGIDG